LNALLVLMGLLLLSYLGSFLVGGRSIQGFGLPSGAEYVVLGLALGPWALGLLDHALVEAFDPIASVALGWLALVIGLDYGFTQNGERVRFTRILGSCLVAIVTAGIVGVATWFAVGRFTTITGIDRLIVSGGVAAACSETTRNAVRWVVERHRAAGPLADLVAELAACDDLVPLLMTAVLFGLRPVATLPWAHEVPHFDLWGWSAITVGIGIVLGVMTVLLLARELRRDETWLILIGVSLLGIGVTARLGLSTVTAMFVVGVVVSILSRHRHAVRVLATTTERPVLHPALLLAGAHLDVRTFATLPLVILCALVARTLAKLLVGGAIQTVSSHARTAGGAMGLGLMSSGALAMTIGLVFALRFPGPVGDLVLATAAAGAILGEFVGPATLRAGLRRAGELHPDPTLVDVEDEVAAS
jgi:Kef-type K+ transport system membrane component KefB